MQISTRIVAQLAACLALVLAHGAVHSQTTVAGFTPGGFRVTESGSASYSIPILVPPGIAGMEPKLSFAYNSQGGNGLLGIGWGVSGLSAIHRCARTLVKDGVNTGVRYESGDRYCLDGQRLVLVSGTYGSNDAEYRTERESFTKVVSFGTAGNGPASFKVWTKSGQVIEYGNTADSRIEAQSIATVRVWALNRIEDVKGNSLTVSYAEDNTNGDFRPTEIAYGVNAAAGGSAVVAHTKFTYESRTDATPAFIAGRLVKVMMRMTNVKTYVGTLAAGVPVADYRIAYDYSGYQGASRATSVTQCTGDGAQCLAPTSMTWQAASGTSGFSGAGSSGGAFGSPYHQSQIVDFNGDGLGDLVYASGTGIFVAYSNGSGFGSAVQVATDNSYNNCYECTGQALFTAGDVNGDGLADIVTGASIVHLSTGGGFSSAGSWGAGFSSPFHQAAIVDFNGDGLGDLVYASGTGIFVAYSSGSGFGSAAQVATDSTYSCYECAGQALFAAGDVNGDGLADIVTGAGVAHLSTGGGFSSAGSWGAGFSSPHHQARIVDFNGDGLGDLVYASGTGIFVAYSYGSGFGSPVQAATESTYSCNECAGQAFFAAGDLNGDGQADIATGGGSAYLATRPAPDLVTRFTNGLGLVFDSVYVPLSNSSVYFMEGGPAWPVRSIKPVAPLNVVASTGIGNGVGGTRTTNYVYREGRVHLKGGGFLGFRAVEAVDAPTGIKSVSSFRQDYPYQGLPLVSERKQSSGTAIGRTTNTWADTVLTPASGSGGNYHKSDLTQQVEQSYELNGSPVTTVTVATAYDAYGNAATVTVGTGDGYSKLTTNTYATPNTTLWFLGRLTRSAMQSTIP